MAAVEGVFFLTMLPEESEGAPAVTDRPRAGYVLLAGLPNAGKSTLLNALIGEPLSIVTPKAQTTWQRIAGIRTEPEVQMVFLDTPGLLAPRDLFQRAMLAEATGARADADVAVIVVDGESPPVGGQRQRLLDFIDEIRCPKLCVINKCDLVDDSSELRLDMENALEVETLAISAETGLGLDGVLEFVRANLPEGPFFFPPDELAQAPVRFFVQEFIRETLFEHFEQDIPYCCAVHIDEFREAQDPVYIAATVHVERKSQKGIVVGKGGAAIQRLGSVARKKIEAFLGHRVYLDLWVKVATGWRGSATTLKRFGYKPPVETNGNHG